MLRYTELSPAQKAHICNGCGGKGGWVKPPNFIFKASCNHHDFKFWQGASIEDFTKANNDFYKWMKIDIKELDAGICKKLYYRVWAKVYMFMVTHYGIRYFSFRNGKKTLEDLNREMIV